METVGKATKLRPFEFVKRIYLTHNPFTVEQGILNENRNQIIYHYYLVVF
jgi:hypothetical protein